MILTCILLLNKVYLQEKKSKKKTKITDAFAQFFIFWHINRKEIYLPTLKNQKYICRLRRKKSISLFCNPFLEELSREAHRWNQSSMALTEFLPKEYGYVVLDLVFYCFLNLWMGAQVGMARKRFALNSESETILGCVPSLVISIDLI